MRILFLADVSMEKVIGGAERVLYEQSTRLARRGHQVHILTRFLPEHERKHEIIEKVNEWRYHVDAKNALTFLFSTRVNVPVILSKLLEEGPFNIINGHQPFTSWAYLLTPFARRMPFIYTCHSLAFEEFLTRQPRPQGLLKNIFYQLKTLSLRRMEKGILRNTPAIIALSDYTRKKLKTVHKVPEHHIHIIPGGVDTERFRPLDDRWEVRKALNLPPDKPVLITVRNLVSRMGLENLIAAAGEIKRAFPAFTLLIGGTGPLKEDLEKMVAQMNLETHLSFLGFIPEEKLPLYLGAADYFILPTIDLEGFGLVTVESLACGTPVLGTPVGGTVEILSPLDQDLLFPDPSAQSMASFIISHLRKWNENRDLYQNLRQKCRQYVEQRYSWEANVEKTEQLFYRLAR